MGYHIAVAGRQEGPVAEGEVLRRIAAGELSVDDLCWTEGWSDWKPVAEAFPQAFVPSSPPLTPPPVLVAAQPTAPVTKRATAPKTSGVAVTSLVLGLLSFFFSILAAFPAIICGHVARSKIKKSGGELEGAGLALAGLILGYIILCASVLTIAAFILIPSIYAIGQVRETAQYTVSQSNLRQVVQAQLIYANDHNGRLADDFEELRVILGSSFDDLMDLPYTDEVETDGYVIVPGLTTSMPSDTVVARESKPRRDGTVAVGYLGGNVEVVFPGLERPPPPPSED